MIRIVMMTITGLPVSLKEKKVFGKANFSEIKVKKRFFRHMIEPFKSVDRLKGTPCDQS